MVGLTGVTDIEANTAVVTVRVADGLVTPLFEAVMPVLPGA